MKRLFFALLFFCAMFVAKADEWTGTGFALKGKYVITNHHVVDGARSLKVRGVRGDFTKLYNAVVVAKDEQHDLAIIRIEDSKFTGFGEIPYAIKSGLSEVGEESFVLGYPMMSTMGEEVKLTTGVISSRTGFMGDVSAYQISAPIQPGNSGGPLFDSNGDVVGIVNAKHRQADNAGYAIKSPYMRLFVENSVSTSIIPTNRKMVGWSLVNKVKAIKPFVFIIYASTEGGRAIATQSQQPSGVGNTYKVGDYYDDGKKQGVVFEVTADGKHGKIVSLTESRNEIQWSSDKNEQKRLIGAGYKSDGANNMAKVMQIEGWRNKYPAFAWCADLGEGWYLPAIEELEKFALNDAIHDVVNNTLATKGKKLANKGDMFWYWSSTEYRYLFSSGELCAWYVNLYRGSTDFNGKSYDHYVRAVSAF